MLSSSFIEMRRRNAVRILQTVREQPGLSRADIARTCDLAKSTVSSVVDELVQEAILQEIGCKESSRGRRPVGLSFNSSSRITVGISLDHTRTEIVLSNLDGVVQSVRTKKHQRRNNIQSISSTLVSELQKLLADQKLGPDSIGAIGLAVPGPLSSVNARNDLDYEALRQWLSKEMNCPVLIDSNANMAALAESRLGVAQDSVEALVVRLGHEVRSALIIDQRLVKGAHGRAGELGHLSVPGIEILCKCGKLGCINAVAAMDAIVGRCLTYGAQVMDIDDVISAAMRGDEQCKNVLADAGHAIGYGIASCINILAPADVIVTGRLVAAGSILIDPLNGAIAKFASADNLRNCNFEFDDSQNHIEAIGASLAVLLQDDFLLSLVPDSGAKLMAVVVGG
jgi:predicted NBD/HSP70 family sugar kinase